MERWLKELRDNSDPNIVIILLGSRKLMKETKVTWAKQELLRKMLGSPMRQSTIYFSCRLQPSTLRMWTRPLEWWSQVLALSLRDLQKHLREQRPRAHAKGDFEAKDDIRSSCLCVFEQGQDSPNPSEERVLQLIVLNPVMIIIFATLIENGDGLLCTWHSASW